MLPKQESLPQSVKGVYNLVSNIIQHMVPCCNWAYFKPETYIQCKSSTGQTRQWENNLQQLCAKITLYIWKTAKQ